ncbi:hypothetical protein ACFLYV_04250 [Chloroflexota bacterium]
MGNLGMKVNIEDFDTTEIREVSPEEAQRIVDQALADGKLVLDKDSGLLVETITEATREISIFLTTFEGG